MRKHEIRTGGGTVPAKKKRRLLGVLAMALVLATVLTGCAGNKNPKDRDSNTLFREGLLAFQNFSDTGSSKYKYGYVNARGRVVIAPRFDMAESFDENGMAWVEVDDKWGVIDTTGAFIIEPRLNRKDSNYLNRNLIPISQDGKWGFVSDTGETVIEPRFDYAVPFDKKGTASVGIDEKYGLINTKGEFVIEPSFDSWFSFGENGLAPVQIGYQYGYINRKGEIVIEPQFSVAKKFYNGLAAVAIGYNGNEWGFINEKGEFVIEPIYDYVTNFYDDGYAYVRYRKCLGDHTVDGWCGVINKKGEIAVRDSKNRFIGEYPQYLW